MARRGFFITFEGGEGGGKTTQAALLADALRKALPDREVLTSRSPGGTPVAERIRAVLKERTEGDDPVPETELLLFAACHAQMSERLIRPALARGAILIVDRFFDSTIVYQGCARGLDPVWIRKVDDFACKGTVPDLTLLLDLDPAQGLRRTEKRAGQDSQDRFDSETLDFHLRVREGFRDLAAAEPGRFAVIDASQVQDRVHARIMEVIRERLDIL